MLLRLYSMSCSDNITVCPWVGGVMAVEMMGRRLGQRRPVSDINVKYAMSFKTQYQCLPR